MKLRHFVILAFLSTGCGPSGCAGSAPISTDPGALTFVGTVTSIEPSALHQRNLSWKVILRVDEVISGRSPGPAFWFAIHSPSQEDVQVGYRYRIRADQKGDEYELIGYARIR